MTLALEQTPRVQGAIFSYDHPLGLRPGDGGRRRLRPLRVQPRHPGLPPARLDYKPIYYSLAIDRGYAFGSALNDMPTPRWTPSPARCGRRRTWTAPTACRSRSSARCVWSRAVPPVSFQDCWRPRRGGVGRRLGFTTAIIADKALALGASCSHRRDLAGFSAFASNGVPDRPVYIRRVRDQHGKVPRGPHHLGRPMLRALGPPGSDRGRFGDQPDPAIPPRAAWLTSTLLRHVVTRGHAPAIRNAASHRRRQDRHLAPPWTSGSSATPRAG